MGLQFYWLNQIRDFPGLPALHDEAFDQPMELGFVVEAVQAHLHEIAAGFGRLFRPQLDLDFANCCFEEDLEKDGVLCEGFVVELLGSPFPTSAAPECKYWTF